MNINFVHPVNKEKFALSVNMSAPYIALEVQIENIIKSVPSEMRVEYARAVVSEVNKAMKTVAVEECAYYGNVWKALARRVTYGAYVVENSDNAVIINPVDVVEREYKVKKNGKEVPEIRPSFVTYADVVKFVNSYNREAKKNNTTALLINGHFTDEEMRKLRYFIKCANGILNDAEVEALKYRGEGYEAFLMPKDSSDGKKARVQIFYDIFNRATGKEVKAIQWIENDIVKECTTFDSMRKVEKIANEVTHISALFNNWLNSELVTINSHRFKNPDSTSKKGKGKGKKQEAPAEAKTGGIDLDEAEVRTIAEGSFADNWIIDKMQEVGCTREKAEAMWWAVYDMIE